MDNVFFLNIDFGVKLTGIERSSLKRALLFVNHLNIIPTFITSKLNLNLQENVNKLKEIGWMPEKCQVVNVYDELRSRGTPKNQLYSPFDVLDVKDFEVVEVNEKHQRYFSKNGNFSMYVVWRNKDKKKLDYINYFSQSKKIRREKFDFNNKLYVTQYLDENSCVQYEDIYNINGELILKRIFNVAKKTIERIEKYCQLKLVSIYNTEQDFLSDWLKEIKIDRNSLLIIDKNKFWSLAASEMRPYCKVASVLHSVHLRESVLNDIYNGQLNSNYAAILNKKHVVDAILTLTEEQKTDILLRYNDSHKIFVIPHSIDGDYCYSSNGELVNSKRLIALCRLSPEKQIEDMINILSILKNRNCDVELYIYGEGGERVKLEKMIEDLDLQEYVYLPGYVSNIHEVYQNAFLSLLTSKCEGFSLAVLESLSHATPVIAYDIKYGPRSMIKHGENGYLFPMRSYEEIADTIESLVGNSDLLNRLSLNAYKSSLKYKELEVSKKWKSFIDEIYLETIP